METYDGLVTWIALMKGMGMKTNCSELARRYGIDRKTVGKYVKEPGRKRKKRSYASGFDAYCSVIREKLAIPGVTLKAVYRFLTEEKGLKDRRYGSFTAYCRRKRMRPEKTAGAHVRYETDPGKQMQVDWVEDMKVKTRDGRTLCFNVFSATLSMSRLHAFVLSERKTAEDFVRCMNEVFRRYGGKTAEILTDNMGCITMNVGKGKQVIPKIRAYMSDAGVVLKRCRPRRPQEKGKVESSNRFVKWLLPYQGEVDSLADLRKALEKIERQANAEINSDTGMAPFSLFQTLEKNHMMPLPDMRLLDSYAEGGTEAKVADTQLVPFRGRQYSVPKTYIGKTVRVFLEGNTVRIHYNSTPIAEHPFREDVAVNYRKEDYLEGLSDAAGYDVSGDSEMVRMAEENLRRLEALKG